MGRALMFHIAIIGGGTPRYDIILTKNKNKNKMKNKIKNVASDVMLVFNVVFITWPKPAL